MQALFWHTNNMPNIENLTVRQKSVELAKLVYMLCRGNDDLAKDYGLKDQLQRSAVSISSNIAEWADRESQKELKRYLYIARWSCSELKTQLIIAKWLYNISDDMYKQVDNMLVEVHKMLNAFIKKINIL